MFTRRLAGVRPRQDWFFLSAVDEAEPHWGILKSLISKPGNDFGF
jgi:hypothetical protein